VRGCARAQVRRQVLDETRALLGDRLTNLGARHDVPDRLPHLIAFDDPVDDRLRPLIRQRSVDGRVERAGRSELPRDPFEHVVVGNRAGELLGQLSRERAIGQAGQLRHEMLVGRALDLASRRFRGGAGREEREPAGCAERRPAVIAGHATQAAAVAAGFAPSRSSKWSPTRSEFAIAVSAGLTAPMLGKTLVSTT